MLETIQTRITEIQTKTKQVGTDVKCWLSKQPVFVEAGLVAASGAVQGGLIGALIGNLTQDLSNPIILPSPNNPVSLSTFQHSQALSGGPMIQARNFAVLTSVNVGISTVLKRYKGKEDVQSSMIAAFGSGAMFSLVSGTGGPNRIPEMLSSGFFFALVQGGLYKVGEKFSISPAEDLSYSKTKSMLTNLGLHRYEKNFKRVKLNDQTLPLLTDSALRDASIPPGPRLLILDHVQRNAEFGQKERK